MSGRVGNSITITTAEDHYNGQRPGLDKQFIGGSYLKIASGDDLREIRFISKEPESFILTDICVMMNCLMTIWDN